MTGNPRARNVERAALPRLTSVSGARPIPPSIPIEVEDTWLDVDDIVQVEARPTPPPGTPPRAETRRVQELEQLLREQQLELEQLRRESSRRIEIAERERDAALAVVEELRASLRPLASSQSPSAAPFTAAQPPPLPPRAPSPSPEGGAQQSAAFQMPALAPAPDAPAPSRQREPGSVPTLSDVLVATDPLLAHEFDAADTDERRSEPRIQRQFELEFNYETHFFAGLSLDISSGGLFIATYHLFPVGTGLSLSFQLPDGARLSVRGEVRWVRCASEGHERPGMGVAFKELTAEALSAISDFCAERPPLYIEL